MVAKEIASLQHPLVKKAVRLRLDRKARDEERKAIVSGRKLILDLSTRWPIDFLFTDRDEKPDLPAMEIIRVSPAVLKKISGLEEPDGYAAMVPLPEEQPLQQMNAIVIFDRISDPGNLGTLWRTAMGLGWQGVWLTPGCVDPFNDKALRASQGSVFHLPFERIFTEEILAWSRKKGASIYTADLHGTPIGECKPKYPLALILGNEGQGPGNWTEAAGLKITIPMSSGLESLNVASAGSILLYTLRPAQ